MNFPAHIDSIAYFGSTVRGDDDRFSDQDILLIGDELHRQYSKEYFFSKGYSPSFYSWHQFDNLIADNSLFIQHLKQESSIVVDKEDRLHKSLVNFKVSTNYFDRLLQNNSLLRLTIGTPSTKAAQAWAFDVLAVAFRNFAILKNAQKGDFIFSYSELVQRVKVQCGLSQSEVDLLLELRQNKSIYRSGQISTNVNAVRLNITQKLLAYLFDVSLTTELNNTIEFDTSNLAHFDSLHWYCRMRWYEGIFRASGRMPSNASSALEHEIEWMFANPSPYGHFDDDLVKRLPKMIQNCLNTHK